MSSANSKNLQYLITLQKSLVNDLNAGTNDPYRTPNNLQN